LRCQPLGRRGQAIEEDGVEHLQRTPEGSLATSCVEHMRHLINLIVRKQTVKPRVAISMDPAAVCQQVINGMHSLSIDGEAISLAGRSGAGPWPFVAHIGPHSSGLRRF